MNVFGTMTNDDMIKSVIMKKTSGREIGKKNYSPFYGGSVESIEMLSIIDCEQING